MAPSKTPNRQAAGLSSPSYHSAAEEQASPSSPSEPYDPRASIEVWSSECIVDFDEKLTKFGPQNTCYFAYGIDMSAKYLYRFLPSAQVHEDIINLARVCGYEWRMEVIEVTSEDGVTERKVRPRMVSSEIRELEREGGNGLEVAGGKKGVWGVMHFITREDLDVMREAMMKEDPNLRLVRLHTDVYRKRTREKGGGVERSFREEDCWTFVWVGEDWGLDRMQKEVVDGLIRADPPFIHWFKEGIKQIAHLGLWSGDADYDKMLRSWLPVEEKRWHDEQGKGKMVVPGEGVGEPMEGVEEGGAENIGEGKGEETVVHRGEGGGDAMEGVEN